MSNEDNKRKVANQSSEEPVHLPQLDGQNVTIESISEHGTIGALVSPGPDFRPEWEDQIPSPPENSFGRLIRVDAETPGWVYVNWNKTGGGTNCYRAGVSGAFDLVYGKERAPVVSQELSIDPPEELLGKPVSLENATRGYVVSRGPSWRVEYGEQDGQKPGVILRVEAPSSSPSSARSFLMNGGAVWVRWGNKRENRYRLAHPLLCEGDLVFGKVPAFEYQESEFGKTEKSTNFRLVDRWRTIDASSSGEVLNLQNRNVCVYTEQTFSLPLDSSRCPHLPQRNKNDHQVVASAAAGGGDSKKEEEEEEGTKEKQQEEEIINNECDDDDAEFVVCLHVQNLGSDGIACLGFMSADGIETTSGHCCGEKELEDSISIGIEKNHAYFLYRDAKKDSIRVPTTGRTVLAMKVSAKNGFEFFVDGKKLMPSSEIQSFLDSCSKHKNKKKKKNKNEEKEEEEEEEEEVERKDFRVAVSFTKSGQKGQFFLLPSGTRDIPTSQQISSLPSSSLSSSALALALASAAAGGGGGGEGQISRRPSLPTKKTVFPSIPLVCSDKTQFTFPDLIPHIEVIKDKKQIEEKGKQQQQQEENKKGKEEEEEEISYYGRTFVCRNSRRATIVSREVFSLDDENTNFDVTLSCRHGVLGGDIVFGFVCVGDDNSKNNNNNNNNKGDDSSSDSSSSDDDDDNDDDKDGKNFPLHRISEYLCGEAELKHSFGLLFRSNNTVSTLHNDKIKDSVSSRFNITCDFNATWKVSSFSSSSRGGDNNNNNNNNEEETIGGRKKIFRPEVDSRLFEIPYLESTVLTDEFLKGKKWRLAISLSFEGQKASLDGIGSLISNTATSSSSSSSSNSGSSLASSLLTALANALPRAATVAAAASNSSTSSSSSSSVAAAVAGSDDIVSSVQTLIDFADERAHEAAAAANNNTGGEDGEGGGNSGGGGELDPEIQRQFEELRGLQRQLASRREELQQQQQQQERRLSSLPMEVISSTSASDGTPITFFDFLKSIDVIGNGRELLGKAPDRRATVFSKQIFDFTTCNITETVTFHGGLLGAEKESSSSSSEDEDEDDSRGDVSVGILAATLSSRQVLECAGKICGEVEIPSSIGLLLRPKAGIAAILHKDQIRDAEECPALKERNQDIKITIKISASKLSFKINDREFTSPFLEALSLSSSSSSSCSSSLVTAVSSGNNNNNNSEEEEGDAVSSELCTFRRIGISLSAAGQRASLIGGNIVHHQFLDQFSFVDNLRSVDFVNPFEFLCVHTTKGTIFSKEVFDGGSAAFARSFTFTFPSSNPHSSSWQTLGDLLGDFTVGLVDENPNILGGTASFLAGEKELNNSLSLCYLARTQTISVLHSDNLRDAEKLAGRLDGNVLESMIKSVRDRETQGGTTTTTTTTAAAPTLTFTILLNRGRVAYQVNGRDFASKFLASIGLSQGGRFRLAFSLTKQGQRVRVSDPTIAMNLPMVEWTRRFTWLDCLSNEHFAVDNNNNFEVQSLHDGRCTIMSKEVFSAMSSCFSVTLVVTGTKANSGDVCFGFCAAAQCVEQQLLSHMVGEVEILSSAGILLRPEKVAVLHLDKIREGKDRDDFLDNQQLANGDDDTFSLTLKFERGRMSSVLVNGRVLPTDEVSQINFCDAGNLRLAVSFSKKNIRARLAYNNNNHPAEENEETPPSSSSSLPTSPTTAAAGASGGNNNNNNNNHHILNLQPHQNVVIDNRTILAARRAAEGDGTGNK